jgi:hypothetical protein
MLLGACRSADPPAPGTPALRGIYARGDIPAADASNVLVAIWFLDDVHYRAWKNVPCDSDDPAVNDCAMPGRYRVDSTGLTLTEDASGTSTTYAFRAGDLDRPAPLEIRSGATLMQPGQLLEGEATPIDDGDGEILWNGFELASTYEEEGLKRWLLQFDRNKPPYVDPTLNPYSRYCVLIAPSEDSLLPGFVMRNWLPRCPHYPLGGGGIRG